MRIFQVQKGLFEWDKQQLALERLNKSEHMHLENMIMGQLRFGEHQTISVALITGANGTLWVGQAGGFNNVLGSSHWAKVFCAQQKWSKNIENVKDQSIQRLKS